MRKIFVIAARDYTANVRTKAFLISVILMPVLMGGGVLIPALLKGRGEAKERKYLVVDRSPGGRLFAQLSEAAERRNADSSRTGPLYVLENVTPSDNTPEAVLRQRLELSERIRQREVEGLLEIGASVQESAAGSQVETSILRYQSSKPLSREFPRWAEQTLNEAIRRQRAEEANLSYSQVQSIHRPVPLLSKGLTIRNPNTGEVQDGRDDNFAVSFLLPYGMLFLMFMMVMMGATPLMQGVMEEKTQRIAEVLLGSIPPFHLMLGKLIGSVGVSLTLSGVYLTGAFLAAWHYGYADYLAPDVLAWFVVFQVLGIFLFGSLFIAVGAACTSAQEAQSLMMPVMMLVVIPMFFFERVVREPDSTLVMVLSFVPFATPTIMVTRLAIPPGIAWWQPALGVVVLLAATLVCVYAAGRIFRVGYLVQGKGASFRQMLQWVFRG